MCSCAAANQGLGRNLPSAKANPFDFSHVSEPKKDGNGGWEVSCTQTIPTHNGHGLWVQNHICGEKEIVGSAGVCPVVCPYRPADKDRGEECNEISCLVDSAFESSQPSSDFDFSQDFRVERLLMTELNADISRPLCLASKSGTETSLKDFIFDSLLDDAQAPNTATDCSCLQSFFSNDWLVSGEPVAYKRWPQAREAQKAAMVLTVQETSNYDQPQDLDGGCQDPERDTSKHRLLDLDCMSSDILFGDYEMPQVCMPDSVTGLSYCKSVQSAGADDMDTFPRGFSQEQLLALAVQARQTSGNTRDELACAFSTDVCEEDRKERSSFFSENIFFSNSTDCPGPVKTQMFLPVSVPMERLLRHTEERLHPRPQLSLASSNGANCNQATCCPIDSLSLAHSSKSPDSDGCCGKAQQIRLGNSLQQVPASTSERSVQNSQEKSPFPRLRLLLARQPRSAGPTMSRSGCNSADSGNGFVQSLHSNRKGLLDHIRRLMCHRARTAIPRASTGRVSVQSQPWYSPLSTRIDVEHHLCGKAEGSFVIRNSSNSRGFSLAVVSSRNEVVHLIIQNAGGQLQVGGDNVSFNDLDGLVKYYRRHRLHVFGSLDTTLKLPGGMNSTGRPKSGPAALQT